MGRLTLVAAAVHLVVVSVAQLDVIFIKKRVMVVLVLQ
jgi:hypothetical protein